MKRPDALHESVPWKAVATLGIKRPGTHAFIPEVAGLTLASALDRASSDELNPAWERCIWVRLEGEEVTLSSREISELLNHPDRPQPD